MAFATSAAGHAVGAADDERDRLRVPWVIRCSSWRGELLGRPAVAARLERDRSRRRVGQRRASAASSSTSTISTGRCRRARGRSRRRAPRRAGRAACRPRGRRSSSDLHATLCARVERAVEGVGLAERRFRRNVERHARRLDPEALEVVELAHRVIEDVDDEGAEVEQRPAAGARAFLAERRRCRAPSWPGGCSRRWRRPDGRCGRSRCR